MNHLLFFHIALWGIFGAAVVTAIALLFVNAPYGRHLRKGWGSNISSTAGWVIMEIPAVATIAVFFFISERTGNPMALVFLCMWQLHYLNRTFIFPFRRRGRSRQIPLTVVLLAITFNVWNGFLNGSWLFFLGPERQLTWLTDPRFIVGASLFAFGMMINHHSDNVLFKLRDDSDNGYKIPRGGFYKFVSMPSYFGELLEWIGWAVATWSLAGLSFAVFTAANLIPRAWANHRWYKEEFEDYPKGRKAVIPFIL